jgi:hypothetical protein
MSFQALHYFLRVYGDWFGGLRLMFSSDALFATAPAVRPSFSPITRVGVFRAASSSSFEISDGVQGFPELRVDLGMAVTPED